MKEKLASIITNLVVFSGFNWIKKYYVKVYKLYPSLKKKQKGEKTWLKKWKVLNKHVMPDSYRIYSNFCDNKTEITPWEILQLYIEPSLNKIEYQDFYSDKNFLDKIYNKKILQILLFAILMEFFMM